MNVSFRQLRLFLALHETGSVSGAARAMHVTQPTASMQLREVTESVGLPLENEDISPEDMEAAIEAGAARIDGSVAGLGAGAGNTPLEVFVAVLKRMGVETGIDLYQIMDVAEDLVVPLMDQPIRVDRDALVRFRRLPGPRRLQPT